MTHPFIYVVEALETRRFLAAAAPVAASTDAHAAHLAHLAHVAHVAHIEHVAHVEHLDHVAHVAHVAHVEHLAHVEHAAHVAHVARVAHAEHVAHVEHVRDVAAAHAELAQLKAADEENVTLSFLGSQHAAATQFGMPQSTTMSSVTSPDALLNDIDATNTGDMLGSIGSSGDNLLSPPNPFSDMPILG